MALQADDLAQIEALLGSPDANAVALADLRSRLRGLSLTRCDASDMGVEPPFREFARFCIYLVDGGDHCWRLTADAERATGIVVVPRKDGA